MKEYFESHPEKAAARLQRYMVLEYPNASSVGGILTALANNPHVEHVERNRPIRLHAVPSDPFYPSNGDPEAHQWGAHLMNLDAAWDLIEGHATIGFIDTGIQPGHPDMEPFDDSGLVPVFEGGNYREQLSYDYVHDDCNPDEQEDDTNDRAGHGMHVAGIASALSNNDLGVAGTCWHCPFAMAQVWNQSGITVDGGLKDSADALDRFRNQGLQVVSMSWGIDEDCDNFSDFDPSLLCTVLESASARDVLLTASSGNDRAPTVEWPARDSRVIAVGGVAPDAMFWDEGTNCDNGTAFSGDTECGSNYGPDQELVAPAKSVLSTVYTGLEHLEPPEVNIPCGDNTGNVGDGTDGFGLCTGTSMAAPAVAGIAGLLRSANPLLSQVQVRQILQETASGGGSHDVNLGYGYPNAGAAAAAVLGKAGGQQITVHLTPLFSLYSDHGDAHLYTTSPQRAAAAVEDMSGSPFTSVGNPVTGYPSFPGITGESPSASVHVFSTPRNPSGLSMVPLYRMTKDANRPLLCSGQPESATERAFAYAVSNFDVLSYREDGYALDGIEGYLIAPSESAPPDAVALHRVYNATKDDWAVVPADELASLPGYASTNPYDEVIGYAYPNVDGDADGLVDAFESMIGTDPSRPDSDDDGLTDGDEVLGLGGGSITDPLLAPSEIFLDDFETGDVYKWSSAVGAN